MKKGLCLAAVLLIIFGWTLAQEDEILKLKEKIIDLQNKGKLGFANFTMCSNIMGFASYVPLPETVLDKNGILLIYYEPINVFTNRKDGLYEIWYTQDMTLLKENGEVVSHWNDILTFHYTTQKPVMDLFAQNSIELKGMLPNGKYKFKATLKDKLTEKTATHIIDFEIR
jgi:hypothetical protein